MLKSMWRQYPYERTKNKGTHAAEHFLRQAFIFGYKPLTVDLLKDILRGFLRGFYGAALEASGPQVPSSAAGILL